MSCNGCRVLRRGCSENCILRPCLEWIESPQAQGNATLFVSKFFGRSDLMTFISAVPENKRPALFQSLLFEACGRTVNPVNGAVGLLSTGSWHVCQAAVETVLAGGALQPGPGGNLLPNADEALGCRLRSFSKQKMVMHGGSQVSAGGSRENTASLGSDMSEVSGFEKGENGVAEVGSKKPKLLNLFA